MYCTNCGEKNKKEAKFCYNCGEKLQPNNNDNHNISDETNNAHGKSGTIPRIKKLIKKLLVFSGIFFGFLVVCFIALIFIPDSDTVDLTFLDSYTAMPWVVTEEANENSPYIIYENGSFISDPTDKLKEYINELEENGDYKFVFTEEDGYTNMFSGSDLGFTVYYVGDNENTPFSYHVIVEAKKTTKIKLTLEEETETEEEQPTETEKAEEIEETETQEKQTTAEATTEEPVYTETTEKHTAEPETTVTTTIPSTQPTTQSSVSSAKKVAEPLSFTSSGKLPSADSGAFQALREFCNDTLTVSTPKNAGTYYIFDFKGSEEDLEILLEYSKLLEKEGMHFTKNAEKIQDNRGTLSSASTTSSHYFYDAGFKYTGNTFVSELQNVDGKACSISIHFTIRKTGSLEGFLCYDITLKAVDLGFRTGGSTEDLTPSGPSACAGLIRTAKGTYETDDGRLYVYPGTAVMLESGVNTPVRPGSSRSDNTYHFAVYDSNDNECTSVAIPKSDFRSGAVFKDLDLSSEQPSHELYGARLNRRSPLLMRLSNGKFYSPSLNNNMYNSATVRIMYLNEAEDIVVLYIYSEFFTEQEILAAYKLSEMITPESDSGGSSSASGSTRRDNNNNNRECSTCKGTGWVDCQRCGGKGYREFYEHHGGGLGSQGIKMQEDCDSIGCKDGKKDCPDC